MTPKTRRGRMHIKGFDNPEMDFQLLRQLGSCPFGGASVGETLAAAQHIREGDPDEWSRAFADLGSRCEQDAIKRSEAKHPISARDAFLRAANYFRAAEYYADIYDPQRSLLGEKSQHCFIQGMQHTGRFIQVIKIPFEEKWLPGYFLKPDGNIHPRHTLMILSGFDGTCEESALQAGLAALERGYNVLLFAGPGQVDCQRVHPETTFRPDYETPIAAVVDYVVTRLDVDPQTLALYGISLGGYFAMRAAARDARISYVILNSPIVDLCAYMTGFMPMDPLSMADEADVGPAELDQIPNDVMSNIQKRQVQQMCTRFGRDSLKQVFQYLQEFRVEEERLRQMRAPSLALVGEGEGEEPVRQAEEFARTAGGPVTPYRFTLEQGAESHCQVGNLSLSCAVVFDWLDEQIVKHGTG